MRRVRNRQIELCQQAPAVVDRVLVDRFDPDISEQTRGESLEPTARQGPVDSFVEGAEESFGCGPAGTVVSIGDLANPGRADPIAHRSFERLDHRVVRLFGDLEEAHRDDDGRNAAYCELVVNSQDPADVHHGPLVAMATLVVSQRDVHLVGSVEPVEVVQPGRCRM